MYDELKEEQIVNKVGGRFKLSTLIQKRLIALQQGAKPLVDVRSGDRMKVVIEEIIQDKIYLDAAGNVQTALNATMMANVRGAFGSMPVFDTSNNGTAGDE
jgi:DNA-directed RNA polymerase subunit omega